MAAAPNNGSKRTKVKGGASGATNKRKSKRTPANADPKGKGVRGRGATGNQAKVKGQGSRPVGGKSRTPGSNGQSTKRNVRTPR